MTSHTTMTRPTHHECQLFQQRLERIQTHALNYHQTRTASMIESGGANLSNNQLSNESISPMVLLVAGEDGHSSYGTQTILKYLFGMTTLEAIHAAHEFESDAYDEIIIGIHLNGIRIFAPTQLRKRLEWLTREIAGVEIIARSNRLKEDGSNHSKGAAGEDEAEPDEDVEADEDELFKIHAFIALTQGFKQILIPTFESTDTTNSSSDTNARVRQEIESWPIVQAFGLDELGRHGFFTLSHQVSALSFNAFQPFAEVDADYILFLLSSRLPEFTQHFQTTCSRLLQAAVEPAPAASGTPPLTIRQLNQDVQGWWQYGIDSLPSNERQHRLKTRTPSICIFGPTGQAVASDSDLAVRGAGVKHYTGLQGYYSRLLAAQPYLPLNALLPLLTPHANSPLHALVQLTDPISQLQAVRTILLRQITPLQENEIEVLEHLIPDIWKKKKKRIVSEEKDGSSSSASNTDHEGDESEEEAADESSSESESEDPDTDEDDESERKASIKPPKSKPVKPEPPRLKKESPGLKDALLLHVLYESLIQLIKQTIIALTKSTEVAPRFPSFSDLKTALVERLEYLSQAKWILPKYFEQIKALRYVYESHNGDSASSSSTKQPNHPVFQVEFARVDAYGHRTLLNLNQPIVLEGKCIYSIAMYLHSIPSREILSLTDDDVLLGRVGFGESFVIDYSPATNIRNPPTTKSISITSDELAEERKRQLDPTYYGTGMTSSSAKDMTQSSSNDSTNVNSGTTSLLIITSSIPSQIILPSFFQAYESKLLASMLSTYAHASAVNSLTSPTELQAQGQIPMHPKLGKFLLDGFSPKLPTSFLSLPPHSSINPTIGLKDPGFIVPLFTPQRVESDLNCLVLYRDDAFLSSSTLAFSTTIVLSSTSTPLLHGNIVFFEKGIIFTGSTCGSFMIEFGTHVLESYWYDGSSEEWPSTSTADDDDESSDGEVDPDDLGLDETDDGDGVFVMDLLEPSNPNLAATTPYTFLQSLDVATTANLMKLAQANLGVSPPPSKFAKACFSVGIVFPKSSLLKRAFLTSIQPVWKSSLEELNIHNDVSDEIPGFCRHVYKQLQEQHDFQRMEARRMKRQPSSNVTSATHQLTAPDATCDFLADLRIHEQIACQPAANADIVKHGFQLLTKAPSTKPVKANPATTAAGPIQIPISIVIGTPGSYQTEFVTSVRAAHPSNPNTKWTDLTLIAIDPFDIQATTQQISQTIGSLNITSGGVNHRLLVAVSTYYGIIPIVEALESIFVSFNSPTYRFIISSVTSVIHADTFFTGPSFSLTTPGVLDQLVRGWTQNCLLITPSTHTRSEDEACILAVRQRISQHSSHWPNLVHGADRRLTYQDVSDLILSDRFQSVGQQRKRWRYQLTHSNLIPSKSFSTSSIHTEFFQLPGTLLLDRMKFLTSLITFTQQRVVYHTDGERELESHTSRARLERWTKESTRTLPLTVASSSAASTAAGRITFTTSSSSLPSNWTIFHVVALVKFEDATSNAGGISHRFLEIRASDGKISNMQTRIFGESTSTAPATIQEVKLEAEVEEEFEEQKEISPTPPSFAAAPVDASIPLDSLPIEIRAWIHAHPTLVSSTSLTTAATSCLLYVCGSSNLTRTDVRQQLLLPAVKSLRTPEMSHKQWNGEVKQQQEFIQTC